ncbi:hypothetical protein AMC99_00600 [Altererythrobacter epoxidivorans]|uniref:ABM domain-containing protein n=1 Tax=Altererythrobacter epoxidivorans TaxID=361183 RepID=A0A0M4M6K4_9SPHN|nr:putative quinol monooxygenase [Altererythrobacter epoxidivorans]ALE15910.1 hypothetical protein AMC99_00600 [Altererythrobacter epoxidivorans]
MILVLGTVRLAPDNLERARAAMDAVISASRAEDGCIAYSYAQDVLDPTIVHVVEKWRDRETLDAHFRTPHLQEWRATWDDIGITDRKLTIFDIDEGSPI